MEYYSEVSLALTKTGVEALKKRVSGNSIPENVKKEVYELFKYASKHARNEISGAEL